MKHCYILYNPQAGGGMGAETAEILDIALDGFVLDTVDMTKIPDYATFFKNKPEAIILCGGDGTVHRFINDTAALLLPNELYYFAAGTTNRLRDYVETRPDSMPVPLTSALRSLPICEVNDLRMQVLTQIDFLCEEDHAVNAIISVDGHPQEYKNVWLTPICRGQDSLEVFVVSNASRRLAHILQRSSRLFPRNEVHLLSGRTITLEFNQPVTVVVDGEKFSSVTKYSVYSE